MLQLILIVLGVLLVLVLLVGVGLLFFLMKIKEKDFLLLKQLWVYCEARMSFLYKYNLEHLSNVYVFHTKASNKYIIYLYWLICIKIFLNYQIFSLSFY